jgi:hypothetical protein
MATFTKFELIEMSENRVRGFKSCGIYNIYNLEDNVVAVLYETAMSPLQYGRSRVYVALPESTRLTFDVIVKYKIII